MFSDIFGFSLNFFSLGSNCISNISEITVDQAVSTFFAMEERPK